MRLVAGLRGLLNLVGLVCLGLVVWHGVPMTGVAWLQGVWARGALLLLILSLLVLRRLARYLRRRRAAAALEETLIAAPVGDGEILAEQMQRALAKIKKSGRSTYLYDLPWYVIIGPPGAGKTTALVHSGLEFPGTDRAAVAGFGGTRNCDFWFAEDAVMIDTAGRYTTHDSDARADKVSWLAFLEQLKQARPDQPINGVILAFSCQDMLTATDETLDSHALAVRSRLAELHDTLRIDVPVYTMFTKADMISGFREFFGTLPDYRRRAVWGVTFQTKDRKEETHRAVPAEFDKLISRVSDEVTDRMSQEPDTAARIAMFGLPGQLAMLQRNVSGFLRRVFETGQGSTAILRGFYFTSGTQEGTPIDQILGAMSRGNTDLQPAFLSGRGRSYFLHDLLKKVIFEERDWVGYDIKAMRRRRLGRGLAMGTLMASVIAAFGLFGYSFWKNASLVRAAHVASLNYRAEARGLLGESFLTDPSTRPILQALAAVRDVPGGYVLAQGEPGVEGLGLSRGASIRSAANQAYSDALERLLRPRMMLALEQQLPILLERQDLERAYQALKVYILLAKEQPGKSDDVAIQAYFAQHWAPEYGEPGLDRAYREINEHLAAMLHLDSRVDPPIKPNQALVTRTQEDIAALTLAQQAYGSILSAGAVLRPFKVMDSLHDSRADLVLRTTDGRPLDSLEVAGLFTLSGYWGFFHDAAATAATRLQEERWVLGEPPGPVAEQDQLERLSEDLHALYRVDFATAWTGMLARIELVEMTSGAPLYPALAAAAAPETSPIAGLAAAVDAQTRLSRFLDAMETYEISPEALASGHVGGQLADLGFDPDQQRAGVLRRIGFNMLRAASQPQGSGAAAPSQRQTLGLIEQQFAPWHALVAGNRNARPMDVLLHRLSTLLNNRQLAGRGGSAALDARGLQAALTDLEQDLAGYPQTIAGFVTQIKEGFLDISVNASLNQLDRALKEDIAGYCTQNIASVFPFADGRAPPIPASDFGAFFGYGGRMERFYDSYLRAHTQRAANGEITAREGSSLGARLSPKLLARFAQAARIRQAFFPPDSARPEVRFYISLVSASPDVAGAEIITTDQNVALFPNASGSSLTWPQETDDIAIALLPRRDAPDSDLRFAGGPWALAAFITSGRNRTLGNATEVTHQLGARAATFRLAFDGVAVPFLMRDISDFSCPTAIE